MITRLLDQVPIPISSTWDSVLYDYEVQMNK